MYERSKKMKRNNRNKLKEVISNTLNQVIKDLGYTKYHTIYGEHIEDMVKSKTNTIMYYIDWLNK